MSNVRPERTMERFSRGGELVLAIQRTWSLNAGESWRGSNLVGWTPPSVAVNGRIQALCEEFNLTPAEWHYWASLIGQA